MEKILDPLFECVDRQLGLYRKLLALFHEEREAVLASDLDELNRVIAEKEETLQHIRREEVRRRQVAGEIAERLGLDPEALTITELGATLDDAPAVQLKQKGARLQALIEEIQIESERNRSLCLHALQFVNSSIRMLANLTQPNQVYHASGRVQGDGFVGRMLSGAV